MERTRQHELARLTDGELRDKGLRLTLQLSLVPSDPDVASRLSAVDAEIIRRRASFNPYKPLETSINESNRHQRKG